MYLAIVLPVVELLANQNLGKGEKSLQLKLVKYNSKSLLPL